MSRFDLHKASVGDGYLLDLQADHLEPQGTRMIAPVLPEDQVPDRARLLHPVIEIAGARYLLVTHLMGAVPKTALREPVANLSDQADDFTRAMDILFQGY
jgi:toxin CcdB